MSDNTKPLPEITPTNVREEKTSPGTGEPMEAIPAVADGQMHETELGKPGDPPAPKAEVAQDAAPKEEPKVQVVASAYQPSGLDPYWGKGGSYIIDETGVRRPV